MSDKYHATIASPKSAAIIIPNDKYGPSASTLPALETFIRMGWTIAAMMTPIMKATKTFFQPKNNPAAAMSFTSPPPIPFPFDTRYMMRSGTDMMIRPSRCPSQFLKSRAVAMPPNTAMKMFTPSGIS